MSAGQTGSGGAASDDDPFDVGRSKAVGARPVSARPVKGRMVRIVCPMCETPGFISSKEVGNEVKCCNSKCLVPVYVAEAPPEPEPEPEPEPASNGKFWMYAGLGLLTIVGGGFGLYLQSIKPIDHTDPITTNTNPSNDINGDDTVKPDTGDPVVKPMTRTEIHKKALDALTKAVKNESTGRGKSVSYAMLASAQFQMGENAAGEKSVSEIASTGDHYSILPLVSHAWDELKAGEAEAANKTADKALGVAASIPIYGRSPVDTTVELVALLVGLGRADEAEPLLIWQAESTSQESSLLWVTAQNSDDFDLRRVMQRSSISSQAEPMRAAVAHLLVFHERFAEAQKWVANVSDPHSQGGCAAMAAAAIAEQFHEEPAKLDSHLKNLSNGLTQSSQSRVWSAAAEVLLEKGNKAAAEAHVAKSLEALNQVGNPEPVALPALLELYQLYDTAGYGLPEQGPMAGKALAAIELAETQQRLGDSASAWKTVLMGLEALRCMAPNVTEGNDLERKLTGSRTQSTMKELQREANLNQSEIASRFSHYVTVSKAWSDQAYTRKGLEEVLLNRAAEAGLIAEVWGEIESRNENTEAETHQDWTAGSVPAVLDYLARAEHPEIIAKLKGLELNRNDITAKRLVEATIIRQQAAKDDWKVVSQRFKSFPQDDRSAVEYLELVLASEFQQYAIKSPEAAIRDIRVQSNPGWKEDTLQLVGASVSRAGHGEKLWKSIETANYRNLETVALMYGIVKGSYDAAGQE